ASELLLQVGVAQHHFLATDRIEVNGRFQLLPETGQVADHAAAELRVPHALALHEARCFLRVTVVDVHAVVAALEARGAPARTGTVTVAERADALHGVAPGPPRLSRMSRTIERRRGHLLDE